MSHTAPHELPCPQILGSTAIVGVIGWPVEHSVSPVMHNAAFAALGLDWCYVPFPVRPEGIGDVLKGMRALGIRGINATVPHKQALLPLVDELTPAARAIGAVNTVYWHDDRLVGHNTDAGGFLRALLEAGCAPEGCSALVLGAGGAARAVVYALAGVCDQVTILNRSPERARALTDALAASPARATLYAGALDQQEIARVAGRAQIVVQTTPLGMWPRVESTVWPEGVAFPPDAFLYDLVYNPRETHLVRLARQAGAAVSSGLGMLVHQGAEAFALWTGQEPPVEVMYRACNHVLGGK